MTDINQAQIETILATIQDPHLDTDLISAKAVKRIDIDGSKVKIAITLGYPADTFKQSFADEIAAKVKTTEGIDHVEAVVDWKVISHAVQKNLKSLPGVKNIIAVASGKGGVGKSTTSVNLALALTAEGARVGLLDADIYGPSQPRMMNLSGAKLEQQGDGVKPVVNYGVQTMSIGYMIDEDTPMIWRGPMVTQALNQMLRETQWDDLDYLIIDLPPGTGDTQLTLSQKIPVSGAVIVTTPQDIALLDARKGLKMFEKVEVSVLGIIENMSTHICSNCGHEEHIFGAGGGQAMSDDYNVALLGSLPLDISIREHVDSGHPTVVANPDSKIAATYREIARRTSAKLGQQAKNYKSMFPNIVIQNT